MDTPTLRERLKSKIDDLTDAQVVSLWHYTEAMQIEPLPDDYDPDNDPLVGFFNGPPDLASRTKDILRDEIDSRSGWTQK